MKIGDWMWLDWSNVPGLLDWIAFVLGGVGIGFTIFQITRSRNTLKAASEALAETRATLIKNQLVSILPGLTEISRTLDDALRKDDPDDCEAALGRYCDYAYESSSLLEESVGQFDEIVKDILKAAGDASAARAALFADTGLTVEEKVAGAATGIRDLGARMRGVAMTIKNDPGKVANA